MRRGTDERQVVKGLTEHLRQQLIPESTILLGYRGSVAHGTYIRTYGPDAHDDKDLLGVCIGPKESYFGLTQFGQKESTALAKDGIEWDSVIYELRKFVRLLLKCNPNVLSLLFLPEHLYIIRKPLGDRLIKERDIFVSREAYFSYVGYAKGQMHRMTHPSGKHMGAKRRRLVEKFHYDTKNASHLIRLLRLGIEFLSTGDMRIEREDAAELIEIKRGEWTLERVQAEANRLFALAQEAFIHSPLPPKPDKKAAEQLTVKILEEWFGKENGQDTDEIE